VFVSIDPIMSNGHVDLMERDPSTSIGVQSENRTLQRRLPGSDENVKTVVKSNESDSAEGIAIIGGNERSNLK
jgi:hypothetical protein